MTRTFIFACIGVALLAGTLAFGVFYSQKSSAQGIASEIVFTPISLDIPITKCPFTSGVTFSPNNFIIMCNDFSVEGKTRFSIINVKVEGNNASLKTISDTYERVSAHSLASDGRILYVHTEVTGYNKGVGQKKSTVYLVDPNTLERQDVTPSNLFDLMSQPSSHPAFEQPAYLWDSKLGLVRFVWNTEDWTLKVWDGIQKLNEVGSVPNILARAQLYVNDRFTFGALTQDGKLFAYDFADGKLKQIDEYASIAKALADTLKTPGNKLMRCTVSKSLAMYGDSQALTFVSVGGKTWSRRTPSALGYRPDGTKRPDSEADALTFGKMQELLQKEAAALPPDYISSMSPQIALSEDSIGVVDMHYKRLIVITPK